MTPKTGSHAAVAEVRDSDRRVGHLGAAEPAAACARREIAQGGHELGERQPVGVVHCGRDEAAAASEIATPRCTPEPGYEPVVDPEAVELRVRGRRARDGFVEQRRREDRVPRPVPARCAVRATRAPP